MALRFEQVSSIFRIDDIYTFIVTYFFSARKKGGEKTLVLAALRLDISYGECFFFISTATFQVYIVQDFCFVSFYSQHRFALSKGYLSPVPVNRSKRVEVLHHDVVQISESVQFPETVQVGHPILPQSWNVIERPDKTATVRVCLSDHGHRAAVPRTRRRHFHPGERQHDWAAPHTPPGHPDRQ